MSNIKNISVQIMAMYFKLTLRWQAVSSTLIVRGQRKHQFISTMHSQFLFELWLCWRNTWCVLNL